MAVTDQTHSVLPALPVNATRDSSWIHTILGDNPYFQAGFGLVGLGVGLSVLRKSATIGLNALQRRMLVTLELNVRDHSYEWFLAWMAHQANTRAAAGGSLPWLRSHELSVQTFFEKRKNGSSSVMFKLIAGPGTHWFKFNGAWMQVKRQRETRSMELSSGKPWETVVITTLSKDRKLFPILLAEARDLAMKEQEGKLVINIPWGIEWKPFGLPRRKRPINSVVLAPGVSSLIRKDVESFLSKRQWYADRGIPYRRGYLLHGPPGSGKTSFIQALAGHLGYDICLLNLSERGLADDKLNHLLSNAPERSVILMEDVDAAFNKRIQSSEDGYQSSVTFSGFLNALDGVASGEERLVFLTTNHPERLDPALVRPGRVDLSVLVDDATPAQARELFIRFYASETSDDENTSKVVALGDSLEKLVESQYANGTQLSMAALQGLFIRSTIDDILEGCEKLFQAKQKLP